MISRRLFPVITRLANTHASLRQRRLFSSQSVPEQVSVPCFSNGQITLDIHHPPQTTLHGNDASAVILFLPTGALVADPETDSFKIETLRKKLNLPVVRINYRCSQQHCFPTPIHDVLAGYDWVLENLLPKRSIVRAGRSETVGKVSVYGEHIGGGLATALALTECRAGQPRVVAAAVQNPVLDWTSLGAAGRLKKTRNTKAPSSPLGDFSQHELQELLRLRSDLFAKPAHYFDPFASPMLFFRSPGIEVPETPREETLNDLEQLSIYEREARELERIEREALESPADQASLLQGRRSSRRFPNKSLGLRLPSFYIFADKGSPLTAQAEELASQLRRSFVRQRKDAIPGASGFGRKVLLDGEEDELTVDEKNATEAGIEDARKMVRLEIEDSPEDEVKSGTGLARFSRVVDWFASCS